MRTWSAVALVACCACGAREPKSKAAELPPAEPVTCVDNWCQFPAFRAAGEFRAIEADGDRVWIVDSFGVARWDGGPDDHPERWTWWTFEHSVLDIWVDDGVAYAVGVDGFMSKFESETWTPIATNVDYALTKIDGVRGGPLWTTGERHLLRFDGSTFTPVKLPPGIAWPSALEVVSADEVWVVANAAGHPTSGWHIPQSAWQYARGEWREHRFDEPASLVDSAAANDVWALVEGDLFRWNGAEWARQHGPRSVRDLYVGGPDDVVIQEDSGYYRRDGDEWTRLTQAHGSKMTRLADGRLVVGRSALAIVDGNQTRWAHRSVGLEVSDAWLGDRTMWVVGGQSHEPLHPRVDRETGRPIEPVELEPTLQIAGYDGRAWQRWTLPAPRAIGVSGFGDEPWVVNRTGDAYHLVAGEWQREATGIDGTVASNPVKDVACTPAGEVWVRSRSSVAHRVDGQWSTIGFDGIVEALDVALDGTVMILVKMANDPFGTPATLLRWDGERFEPMGPIPISASRLYALGRSQAIVLGTGELSRWNGATWTESTRVEGDRLFRVHDRMLVERDRRLFELDTGEELVVPFWAEFVVGNSSGQTWVISRADELAFRQP